jgi:hypothetical protein
MGFISMGSRTRNRQRQASHQQQHRGVSHRRAAPFGVHGWVPSFIDSEKKGMCQSGMERKS